jgi:polyisoprenoid-binding protein YceI
VKPAALLALGCATITLALAADAGLDVAHSTISATFRQESVPVEAPFRKFTGRIHYDASNPAGASASIDVDTGSFDIGDPAYNAEVRKPAWFDSASFPFASYRSTGARAISATRFEVTGSLYIKGRSLTITVPINIVAAGLNTAFDGTLPVSRKAFGIGDPSWDDVIEDQVNVHFHLVNASR